MTIFSTAVDAGAVTGAAPTSCLKPAANPSGFLGVGLLHWEIDVHAGCVGTMT